MKVSIASDHAGFEEKELLKPYLVELGHEVIDRGPDSDDRVDYPDFAEPVIDIAVEPKTAYEMLSGDWSSDVCSSDLGALALSM